MDQNADLCFNRENEKRLIFSGFKYLFRTGFIKYCFLLVIPSVFVDQNLLILGVFVDQNADVSSIFLELDSLNTAYLWFQVSPRIKICWYYKWFQVFSWIKFSKWCIQVFQVSFWIWILINTELACDLKCLLGAKFRDWCLHTDVSSILLDLCSFIDITYLCFQVSALVKIC